ncbi:MAG: DUF1330 domain-containing protein [Granulosicoccus sp.]
MPKAYWIAHVDVTDEAHYPEYLKAGAPVYKKYNARFVVRGGRHQAMEGEQRARHVVIEFKDYETAMAAYNSEEYQAARALRNRFAESEFLIVEGVD